MRHRIFLLTTALLLVGALLVSQKQRSEVPVGPDALLYFIADMQRELSRLPVAFTRLSDEEEIRIGNELARYYAASWEPSDDPSSQAIQAYVERVGSQVAARARRKLPYRFHYLRHYGANAFALPGGHVFIGSGLLRLLDTEDELAAILGHEIEHIDHYHCAERVQLEGRLRRLRLEAISDLVRIPIGVFQVGYSKVEELEADAEGTRLAVRASYSPLAAVRLFEKFDELAQAYEHAGGKPRTPQEEVGQILREGLKGYFRSHPPSAERAQRIRALIAREGWEARTSTRPLAVSELLVADGNR